MRRGWGTAAGAAIAVVVVAVVVVAVAAGRDGAGRPPTGPAGTPGDVGASSTVLPPAGGTYWDPGRMGSAVPAPMPTD